MFTFFLLDIRNKCFVKNSAKANLDSAAAGLPSGYEVLPGLCRNRQGGTTQRHQVDHMPQMQRPAARRSCRRIQPGWAGAQERQGARDTRWRWADNTTTAQQECWQRRWSQTSQEPQRHNEGKGSACCRWGGNPSGHTVCPKLLQGRPAQGQNASECKFQKQTIFF